MSYKHLSLKERFYIETDERKGISMNKIAKALNHSQSTTVREIKRNTGKRRFRHEQANNMAKMRHKNK